MSPSPAPAPPSRPARLLIGLVFLALAAFWAWTALTRGASSPTVRVTVKVLDAQGKALSNAQVRTRYGGAWIEVGAGGQVELADPRMRATQGDPTSRVGNAIGDAIGDAIADAIEARAAYHARRRSARSAVRALGEGRYEATLQLEPCGLLRIGVAPSGFPGARATVDPDRVGERWRLIEGNDVIRAGEAATYAVFADAEPTLWATLEGDRGVAQVRIELPRPGLGQLLERSLGPEQAQPIRGRVLLPEGAWAPSLHGVLEVKELREKGPALERPAVRIAADGSFAVEYAGLGRFELTAKLPFAAVRLPAGAASGDEQVRIDATPLPWIEVDSSAWAGTSSMVRVSLFDDGQGDILPRDGAVQLERGLAVATPGPGSYRVVVVARATDEAPPRSGEARVDVPPEGSVRAAITLSELPHGTLVVRAEPVPAPGGEVRLAPERTRTLLPKVATSATFANVPAGQALLSASWRDGTLADELFVAEVKAGGTTEVRLLPVKGGRVRIDVAGTWAENEPKALLLRIVSGQSPYGAAEGLIPLQREGTIPVLVPRAALRPGAYRARIQRLGANDSPLLEAEFTIVPGSVPEARARTP